MVVLGVILARAGSKGLPDKCVRPLLGRPLIEYTIDHALAARRLSAVVLTTDSPAARRIAAARGIEVIDRPPELATDTASVDAAARHAVQVWEQRHGAHVQVVVLLYANIPVRAAGVIDRALELLERSGASSIRTVAPIGRHHPDWLHRLEGDRMVQFRPNSISRRQDLEPLYYHDGAVIAVTRAALFEALSSPDDQQAFLGPDRRALVQRCEDAVDVDEPFDLAVAEAILRAARPGNADPLPAEPAPGGPVLKLGSRTIADGAPAVIVAEAGVNHNGSLDEALRLVDAAAESGADAVKFQLFRAAELATDGAALAAYQRAGGAPDRSYDRIASQREMLQRLELTDEDFAAIRRRCAERGLSFLATPFSPADVARLTALDPAAIKIASTDIDNTPLLRAAAGTGRLLILSTGAALLEEIDAAVRRLSEWGCAGRLMLLHCVSCYPTPLKVTNLRAVATLRRRFGVLTGLSDHTTSALTGGWAVALGARLLEKHFTLDRSAPGPDHAMSLDPAGLRRYIRHVRSAERALGSGQLGMSPIEAEVRALARKSVVARRDLPAGTLLSPEMLTIKRPGGGIRPDELESVVGRRLLRDVARDMVLTWDAVF